MQTRLPPELLATGRGREADGILRACVHCGLCLATCPTYQLLGSELDSPRGRIYLIKSLLEGRPATRVTRRHLDRCLGCQACETTCPSGVNYHRLLDIGRAELQRRAPYTGAARIGRRLLRAVLPWRRRFTPLLRCAQWLRWLLPAALRAQVPPRRPPIAVPNAVLHRRVLLVQGCVQPGLAPQTNQAAARVLQYLGIEALELPAETCCGAISHHLHAQQEGLNFARRNIDAWWPYLAAGAEAIVMTASGCSNFVQDYAVLLAHDPAYAERARAVCGRLKDISELLRAEPIESLPLRADTRISWHCPCTAQHGQRLDEPTREVLQRLGFSLPPIRDAHLCCGSAGTWSLLQPEMASTLRSRKLSALEASQPQQIVTANIGCQVHLGAATKTPVVHWIELVARSLEPTIKP